MAPRGQGANTPTRPIRVDLRLWEEFGEVAAALDTDRSALIRDFMAWMTRRSGAKMPRRPDIDATEAAR